MTNLKIKVAYPKPVKFYISLSYDILSTQYQALNPNIAFYGEGEWELWEELWDTVLTIMHREFERQNCKVISRQGFNPENLAPTLPKTMTENLNECYTIIPCPPSFDTQGIVDALAANGLHDGILFLKYMEEA